MVQTGVQRTFGAKLRRALAGALRSRVRAVLMGGAVTVVLQSSTATALMLNAFASAGLVALAPGLAVMLGANVGSTLVVQALSFDVVLLAPLLILVGVALFRRWRSRPRDFGRVLIGLGLVLIALHQFLALLEPLVATPGVMDVLGADIGRYAPLVVLAAALFTWLAHSSVVTVLLAMSLAAKGGIGLDVGVAVVLGANLGSSLNPLLQSAGAGDPASRRLAAGNVISRLVGVVPALVLLDYASPYLPALGEGARALANVHTLFNVVLAIVFLPVLGPFASLLERLLPSRPGQAQPGQAVYLDPQAQASPSLALGHATREALRMADTLESMLTGLREALRSDDRAAVQRTRAYDDALDGLNSAIKTYVLSLALDGPQEAERQTEVLMFALNLEHAGDLVARDLLSIAERRQRRGVSFSAEEEAELLALLDRVIANLRIAASLFLSRDPGLARTLAVEKEAFRDIEAQGVASHFARLRSGDAAAVEASSLHLDALRDLKRLNSHIVEAAAYPILRTDGGLFPSRLRRLEAPPPRWKEERA